MQSNTRLSSTLHTLNHQFLNLPTPSLSMGNGFLSQTSRGIQPELSDALPSWSYSNSSFPSTSRQRRYEDLHVQFNRSILTAHPAACSGSRHIFNHASFRLDSKFYYASHPIFLYPIRKHLSFNLPSNYGLRWRPTMFCSQPGR